MTSNLYKRYPCPAQGHLDFTIKIDRYGDFDPQEFKLDGSRSRTARTRVHTLVPVYGGVPFEVTVIPRSPNSKWSEQWD